MLLTLLVACAVASALWAETPTRQLLQEAAAAQKSGELTVALEKLEAARAQRPDYPRIHVLLARLHATAGRKAEALAALGTLADYGLAFDFTQDPVLGKLASEDAWDALVKRFVANDAPHGNPAASLTLPGRDGIIETAVRDSKGRWFIADVRNRCIWLRETDGTLREFSSARDGLLGVFSLLLDEARGRLWAGISATPEIKNFSSADQNWAYLAEYDLATGACVHTAQLSSPGRPHVLGSLTLAPDGSIFASDSTAPFIWRFAPGAAQAEAWLENADFLSLQGLAFSSDGRSLYVADYANGIWRIDTATKQHRLLRAPAGTTLFAVDDMRFAGSALVGVQNGLNPQRVVRLTLDEAGDLRAVEVLASGHTTMSDLAGGSVHDGRYWFIGNSGWALFEKPGATPPARDVLVLSVPL